MRREGTGTNLGVGAADVPRQIEMQSVATTRAEMAGDPAAVAVAAPRRGVRPLHSVGAPSTRHSGAAGRPLTVGSSVSCEDK